MPSQVSPLTDVRVRTANDPERIIKLNDGGGLQMWIFPDGAERWRLKYRFGGKEKSLALGVYPEVKLSEAREHRESARALLRAKVDPGTKREDEKRTVRLKSANTFEIVAREWLAKEEQRWTAAHQRDVAASLEREVFPTLGNTPVAEITPADVLECIKRIEKRGALEIAHRVAQRVTAVFRYAILRCALHITAQSTFRNVVR